VKKFARAAYGNGTFKFWRRGIEAGTYGIAAGCSGEADVPAVKLDG
jgi:hypothetical protein